MTYCNQILLYSKDFEISTQYILVVYSLHSYVLKYVCCQQKKKSATEDPTESSSSEDADGGEDEELPLPGWVSEDKNGQKGFRITEAEQEEMGRVRIFGTLVLSLFFFYTSHHLPLKP